MERRPQLLEGFAAARGHGLKMDLFEPLDCTVADRQHLQRWEILQGREAERWASLAYFPSLQIGQCEQAIQQAILPISTRLTGWSQPTGSAEFDKLQTRAENKMSRPAVISDGLYRHYQMTYSASAPADGVMQKTKHRAARLLN